jgi:hypothetical protein
METSKVSVMRMPIAKAKTPPAMLATFGPGQFGSPKRVKLALRRKRLEFSIM